MAARFHLIAAIAATSIAGAAAGAASNSSDALPNHKWWEKVTVTVASEDAAPGCTFSSSHETAAMACDVEAEAGALAGAGPAKGQLTKIVFERRFDPGLVQPEEAELDAGEMLLGGQVLKLAIDGSGKVAKCDVVSTAGELKPDYGCAQAAEERFASAAPTNAGYMTVLIYAHSEQVA